jgi:hypothetical protein
MSPQEQAFRRYLAELLRFLARPRREQAATMTDDQVYARLRELASQAGDSDSYLFRIARAVAYEGSHRRTSH